MRSPRLSEKMASERGFCGLSLRARSSDGSVNPFEITAFFGVDKSGEKFRESASGGGDGTGFEPSLFFAFIFNELLEATVEK